MGEPAMPVDVAELARSALVGELEQLRAAVRELAEPLSDVELWAKPVEPGNFNHFVGAQLGGTDYVRDREREFTETQQPARAELLSGLDAAAATFRQVVEKLTPEQLAAPHPSGRFGPTLHALLHLVAHFALHRGQMSYIARL